MTARCVCSRTGARSASRVFPTCRPSRELGYTDVEFYIWAGLFAPKGMPALSHWGLRETMKQAMSDPEVTKTFEAAGNMPAYQDSEEFAAFVAKDSARLVAARKIGKVLTAAVCPLRQPGRERPPSRVPPCQAAVT